MIPPRMPRSTLGLMLRRTLSRWFVLPCYVSSDSKARHYLSSDPIDDLVLEEILGSMRGQFFPPLPAEVDRELAEGGCVMDIGAYGGYWTAEMLSRHPRSHAILMEPNPEKKGRILRTLTASRVLDRSRVIWAGLGASQDRAWLIASGDGSWGDWTQAEEPTVGLRARPVEIVTLADALRGERPTVVKCNAEGAEFTFVRQAIEADIRPALLILMVHPEHGDAEGLRADLSAAGYSVEVALDHPTRPCWHARRIEGPPSP